MNADPPRLAVIIVSWNVRGLLEICLRTLLADLDRLDVQTQVWVVDNASHDGSPAMIREAFPQVHLVENDKNLGFSGGNNIALSTLLQSTQHETHSPAYIWLLNPDTEVQPGATSALLSALETEPRAGVAGPKLLYPDGSLQQSAFRFPGLTQLAFEFYSLPPRLYDTPLNGRYAPKLYARESPFPVDHPLGAAMMVRAAAVEQVGLMDNGYRMYCEEIDWCWRMRRAGWHALCAPSARVIHHAGQSTGQVPVPSFINLWTSRARLYARHHGPLTWRLARAVVAAGMRRRMQDASPEMVAACRQVIQTWEHAR